MSEENPKIPKNKDEMWEDDPHYRGFAAMLDELNAETERGVALVVTSYLDTLLGDALAAFLVDNESAAVLLSGFNAPLGTLSTKIAACHALGIITDAEMRECNIARRIRNEFAHQIEVTFETDRVRDLCANLTVHKNLEGGITSRQRFVRASMSLLTGLINRPHYVGEKRLKYQNWKL
jgi:hypothetical protein